MFVNLLLDSIVLLFNLAFKYKVSIQFRYLVLVRNVLLQHNKIINKNIHNTGKNENVYLNLYLKLGPTNTLIEIF